MVDEEAEEVDEGETECDIVPGETERLERKH